MKWNTKTFSNPYRKRLVKPCKIPFLFLTFLQAPLIKFCHKSRTQRTSTQPQHTTIPRQVITNIWTVYMAAIIDPERVDCLDDLLGWRRHTENLYRRVQAYRPKFLQSPVSTPFWEMELEMLHTSCWMCPCRALCEWMGFYFHYIFWGQIYLGFVLFGIFGSKSKKHSSRAR